MKYAELKRIFNTIIDVVGDTQILDQEQYDILKAQHQFLYKEDEHYLGFTISYQIKDRVVEPLFIGNVVVKVEGSFYAVHVPCESLISRNSFIFDHWKNGDFDFHDCFGSNTNVHEVITND